MEETVEYKRCRLCEKDVLYHDKINNSTLAVGCWICRQYFHMDCWIEHKQGFDYYHCQFSQDKEK